MLTHTRTRWSPCTHIPCLPLYSETALLTNQHKFCIQNYFSLSTSSARAHAQTRTHTQAQHSSGILYTHGFLQVSFSSVTAPSLTLATKQDGEKHPFHYLSATSRPFQPYIKDKKNLQHTLLWKHTKAFCATRWGWPGIIFPEVIHK